MIDWNEVTTLDIHLSTRERNFRKLGNTTWRWSCSVCGDSKKDSRKARFYVGYSESTGRLMCNCHNCGHASSLSKYLEFKHPDLHRTLQQEKFLSQQPTLFDVDGVLERIFEEEDGEDIIYELLYLNRFREARDWVAFLKKKNIKLSKNNFQKLYNLFRLRTEKNSQI